MREVFKLINNCGFFSFLFSIVIGIIIAIVYYFAKLPLIVIPVAVSLVIAILLLILFSVFLLNKDYNTQKCLNFFSNRLIISILGTISISMIFLTRILIPITIVNTIFIFLNAFFFALMLITFAMLLNCIAIQCIKSDKKI